MVRHPGIWILVSLVPKEIPGLFPSAPFSESSPGMHFHIRSFHFICPHSGSSRKLQASSKNNEVPISISELWKVRCVCPPSFAEPPEFYSGTPESWWVPGGMLTTLAPPCFGLGLQSLNLRGSLGLLPCPLFQRTDQTLQNISF